MRAGRFPAGATAPSTLSPSDTMAIMTFMELPHITCPGCSEKLPNSPKTQKIQCPYCDRRMTVVAITPAGETASAR